MLHHFVENKVIRGQTWGSRDASWRAAVSSGRCCRTLRGCTRAVIHITLPHAATVNLFPVFPNEKNYSGDSSVFFFFFARLCFPNLFFNELTFWPIPARKRSFANATLLIGKGKKDSKQQEKFFRWLYRVEVVGVVEIFYYYGASVTARVNYWRDFSFFTRIFIQAKRHKFGNWLSDYRD